MAIKEAVPLPLIGTKAFPDFEITKCNIDKFAVSLSGQLKLNSVLSKPMIDGHGELQIFTTKSEGIAITIQTGQTWEEPILPCCLTELLTIGSRDSDDVMLEGLSTIGESVRISVPHATVYWVY